MSELLKILVEKYPEARIACEVSDEDYVWSPTKATKVFFFLTAYIPEAPPVSITDLMAEGQETQAVVDYLTKEKTTSECETPQIEPTPKEDLEMFHSPSQLSSEYALSGTDHSSSEWTGENQEWESDICASECGPDDRISLTIRLEETQEHVSFLSENILSLQGKLEREKEIVSALELHNEKLTQDIGVLTGENCDAGSKIVQLTCENEVFKQNLEDVERALSLEKERVQQLVMREQQLEQTHIIELESKSKRIDDLVRQAHELEAELLRIPDLCSISPDCEGNLRETGSDETAASVLDQVHILKHSLLVSRSEVEHARKCRRRDVTRAFRGTMLLNLFLIAMCLLLM